MTLQERERVIVPFKLDDVMHLATDFGYFGVVVWRHNNDLFFTADKWQHDFTSVGNLRAHGEKVLDGLEFQYKLAKKQEQEYSSKSIEEQDRLPRRIIR